MVLSAEQHKEHQAQGKRIRALRKDRGMSLRELSDRSGVSASQISRFERGMDMSMARYSALLKVLEALHAPPTPA